MPQVDDVVGVVVCDEDARPVVWAHARLHELHAHARARVDQKLLVAVAEQCGGTAALRIGRGRTGAEENGAHNVRRVPAGAGSVKAGGGFLTPGAGAGAVGGRTVWRGLVNELPREMGLLKCGPVRSMVCPADGIRQ